MKYKPSYRSFKWNDLPESMEDAAIVLGFDKRSWDSNGKKNSGVLKTFWGDLPPEKKAAAFRLGWDEMEWDLILKRSYYRSAEKVY